MSNPDVAEREGTPDFQTALLAITRGKILKPSKELVPMADAIADLILEHAGSSTLGREKLITQAVPLVAQQYVQEHQISDREQKILAELTLAKYLAVAFGRRVEPGPKPVGAGVKSPDVASVGQQVQETLATGAKPSEG